MVRLDFSHNPKIHVGVEIEIQLIDPETGDLKPIAPMLLESLKGHIDAKFIKAEIFQSMLEIETPICESAIQVGESLRKSLEVARTSAYSHNAMVMMSGTHPFAHYRERRLSENSRYHDLLDRNQWITRRLQIFGLHIHLGMRDGNHAIEMNNALCHYLPIVLALSASSPFWHGEDTGLASSRITFFEAIPTGGHPYLLKDWSAFESLVDKLIISKSIKSIKDLWWDLRPNVEFGTLEVRIADCPPSVTEVEAIVALVHCLALFIDEEIKLGRRFSAPPEWILRENKWRASRHGVQCELVESEAGESKPFLEIWREIKESTRTAWERLNYGKHFSFLDLLIEKGPSYVRQRRFNESRVRDLVSHLIYENVNDYPDWMKK